MMDQAQALSVLDLPDSLLLKVFTLLSLHSVRCVSLTCPHFSRIALDPQLWKTMFRRDFKVPQAVHLRPKARYWRAEYQRLYDESPAVLCEELVGHEDEVLHVSFSKNGEMFATCSKDGLVKVWEATTPCTLRFSADLKTRLNWRYTHYSQFNESDSLLLVAGVVDFEGEIVIFDLNQDLKLLSRILSRPNDVNGTWFDDHHVLSGTLHPTNFISSVWLAKATREVKSTRKYDMINPYRFQILTNGGMDELIVADILHEIEEPTSTFVDQLAVCSTSKFGHNDPPNDLKEIFVECDEKMPNHRNQMCECGEDVAGCAVHASVPFIQNTTTSSPSTQNRSITSRKNKPALNSPQVRSLTKAHKEKLLIFTYGEVFLHSHMVGIKRMREDEILEEEEAREGLRWPETEEGFLPHTHSDVGGTGRLSNRDYSFNMYGRIVGMALSPDQRYLYVNTRRWTEDYVIDDETEPPLADEIDIHIISLMTFTQVNTVLRSHKAFPGANVLLYLDVNELYVTSGSGDNQGYMWDRHYGVHVRCFPHDNMVSCCAFNPMNPEMLVTVSDDFKIKIWRSRRQMREIREKKKVYKYETATPATVADGNCLEGRDNSDTLSGRRETTREDCNCSFFLCCFRK